VGTKYAARHVVSRVTNESGHGKCSSGLIGSSVLRATMVETTEFTDITSTAVDKVHYRHFINTMSVEPAIIPDVKEVSRSLADEVEWFRCRVFGIGMLQVSMIGWLLFGYACAQHLRART
jgi:hypothetical protein